MWFSFSLSPSAGCGFLIDIGSAVVMYDEMSNKRRNTEGVVTNPFVMFNVSASFCTARAFVMVRAQCACANRPCSSVSTQREREREKDVVELL